MLDAKLCNLNRLKKYSLCVVHARVQCGYFWWDSFPSSGDMGTQIAAI